MQRAISFYQTCMHSPCSAFRSEKENESRASEEARATQTPTRCDTMQCTPSPSIVVTDHWPLTLYCLLQLADMLADMLLASLPSGLTCRLIRGA